jgi:ATP-dependent RNA helicase DeaD
LKKEVLVSRDFAPAFDAAHRAALEHGKPIVYVCPPAAWALGPLLQRLPATEGTSPSTLVLAPDEADIVETAGAFRGAPALQPVHALTGLTRTEQLLKRSSVATLVAAPLDALRLVSRSALKLDSLRHVVVIRPENMPATGPRRDLDSLLSDAGTAQRVIVTVDDGAISDFLERHARRAPVVVHSRLPERPLGPARYTLVDRSARVRAVRVALDILNPQSTLLWDPEPNRDWEELAASTDIRRGGSDDGQQVELAIATELPSAEIFADLLQAAERVLALAHPGQLPYLQELADPLKPLRLPTDVDRVRARAVATRAALRERLQSGGFAEELLAIEPLLEEYDPSLLAAAALARHAEGPETEGEVEAWTRLFISVGRKDGARAADLLGAAINAAGLRRHEIGRIEVKETFTLVDVRSETASQAIKGLTGETIKGRRVTARPDRG